MKKKAIILIIILAAASLIMRLLPHPANFVPIGALALASGVYFRSKWAILLPAAVMGLSDLIIGWHSLVLFTWSGFLLFGVIGWWIQKKKNLLRLIGGTLLGSVLFFIITNFAVWAFTPLYQKTAAGLVQCFYLALPFFRNSLTGDLFYAAVFLALLRRYWLARFMALKKP